VARGGLARGSRQREIAEVKMSYVAVAIVLPAGPKRL
jgi:hypothetical protein